MVQTEIRIRTKVLPGKRIEVTSPDLTEGDEIEVVLHKKDAGQEEPQEFANVMEFLRSLPPSRLTMEDWERIEHTIQEEKNSWGD